MDLQMARIADPNRRAAILSAARAVFDERGYSQTRMAEIATQAGIAPGTIYLYFDSKESIVLALAEQFYTRLSEATLPVLEGDDLQAVIAEVVAAGLRFAVEEHDLLKLMRLDVGLQPLLKPLPARRLYHQALAARMRAWQERGALPGYDAHILADLLTGMVERAAESIALYGAGDLHEYEATIITLLHHALRVVRQDA